MFYERYLMLCQKKGISPSKVAEINGINKSNVSNWKNNGYTPRGETLQQLADYFGVSVDFLLGKEEEKDNNISKDTCKLRSISRLEELEFTPKEDEQVLDFINYLITKRRNDDNK